MKNLNALTREVLPVSVVIASLGGEKLINVISKLNQGNGVPSEIIVSVPGELFQGVADMLQRDNVMVIKSECRGQVIQRSIGLKMASNPYVLQMDDDVIFENSALKLLVENLITKGKKNIIAPLFKLQLGGENSTKSSYGAKGFLLNCYYYLICGALFGKARYGTISPAGIGFGILMEKNTNMNVESEWLPGGAVICHKEDLIFDNYYPFAGKAYSEDLIHSVLWRQNNNKMWTNCSAIAFIEITNESMGWKDLLARLRAHIYVAKMVKGSPWRSYLWFFFHIIYNANKIIFQKFKKNYDNS